MLLLQQHVALSYPNLNPILRPIIYLLLLYYKNGDEQTKKSEVITVVF